MQPGKTGWLLYAAILVSVSAQAVECDGKMPPQAPSPCTASHDVVIALDNSVDDVEGGDNARTELLNTIVAGYKLGETPTGPRIALLQFDNTALVLSNLTDSASELTLAVANRPAAATTATQSSGGTCTYCAIETAQTLLTSSSARADARKVLILLIDGIAVSAGKPRACTHLARHP